MGAVNASETSELQEEVRLPLHGYDVTQCCVDIRLVLNFLGDGPSRTVSIESVFELTLPDGQLLLLQPGENSTMGPTLLLHGKTARDAVAYSDGALQIRFTDGTSVRVPRNDDYEAWELTGEDGYRVVATPQGGLVTWAPRAV